MAGKIEGEKRWKEWVGKIKEGEERNWKKLWRKWKGKWKNG